MPMWTPDGHWSAGVSHFFLLLLAVLLPAALGAQSPPTVEVLSHYDGMHVTSPSVSIQFGTCSDYPITWKDVTLNGSAMGVSSGGAAGCAGSAYEQGYRASGTLAPNANAVSISVCDNYGGCGYASLTIYYDAPAPVASVTITPGSWTAPQLGATQSFSAQAYDASNNPLNGRAVSWASSSGAVTLSASSGSTPAGVTATATAAASATITATVEGVQATASVQPATPHPQTVVVTLGSGSIAAGTSTSATATVTDQWGNPMTGQAITWSSSSAGVASVQGSGETATVTGVAAGSATISAQAGSASGSAAVSVTASQGPVPTSVTVSFGQNPIAAGGGTTATATLRDQNGVPMSGYSATWSSSNASVASVASTGPTTASVSGISGGSASIYAMMAQKTGSAVIQVNSPPPPSPDAPPPATAPMDRLERGLCAAAPAGTDGVYRCGDLQLAHELPAVMTRGVSRAPALVYNSNLAQPYVVVPANVTISSSLPAVVTAKLVVAGDTVASGSWNGSDWGWAGNTRRIALGFDASARVTGVYPCTLVVRRETTGAIILQQPGQVVIVNRAASPYGAGWWPAGLEELRALSGNRLLWIGGDGSHRIYEPTASNVWTAVPDLLRRERITFDGVRYTRHLPQLAKVRFNTAGQHVATLDRKRDSTVFTYAGSTLGSTLAQIVVPGGLTYDFTRESAGASARVVSVSAPGAAAARVTLLGRSLDRILSITDPDSTVVRFGYSGNTSRISTRINRLDDTSYYAFDTAGKLREASVGMRTGNTPLTTAFTAFESRGLPGSAAVSAASAFTRIDGPRTDVGDTTRIWLDGRGAPVVVRNALGDSTVYRRGDSRWPALVTEVRSPTGFITQATYDSLGHIETSTEVQPLGTTANAVTQYVWDPALDVVTQVTPPVGDATTFGYDSLGNRLWQQTGSLGSRRVNFRYDAQGRYVATEAPLTWRDSVVYGALGNVDSVRAENGGWMSYERDAIGRDTLVRSSIDIGKTGTIRRVYDRMGRDSVIVTAGPEMSFAFECTQCSGRAVPAESLTVTTSRDREGRIISIDPKGAPSAPGVDILQSSFVLDPAGRRLKEHHPGFAETYTYDGAGNVVQTVTARNDTVLAAYDALNRLQQRIVPAATYPAVACTASAEVPCNLQTTYAGYQVPRDTAAYLYDADGHLVQADNRDAHVARSYYSNGLLKSDTLRLARWDRTGFASHVYGLVYTYDLAGRRLTMTHPGSILPGAQTSYSYATWGPLDGMTATFGPGHSFSWVFRTDDAGRPSSLTMPGNLTADFAYDSAGQFVRRQLGALFNDTLTYDLRGKLRVADMRWGDGTFTSWYSGLGMLVGARWERGNGVTVDEYRTDAHGNTFWTWKRDALGIDTTWNQHSAMALLEAYRSNSPTAVKRREGYRGYDAANNVQYATDDRWTNGNPSRDAGRSYYGADQKLRRVERYLGGGGTPRVSLFRYDALGRRVVTMDSGCAADCDNAITRAVWDGDELLYELRGGIATPEVATGTGTKYGAVGYVHGLTIDQPIGLYRMGFTTGDQFIVPHANFRGHFVRGTDSTGANCCSGVNWPAPSMGAFLEGAPGPSDWIGSLIQDQRDMSGLLYRRNRYYDPATGRFTQQDPIGLAGGLNLFGFAGGDPVSYSDPFGLSDCKKDEGPCPNPIQQAAEGMVAAATDLYIATLDKISDVIDAVIPVKSLATMFGLNPNAQGAGARAGAALSAGAALITPGASIGERIGIQEGKAALQSLMAGDFRVMAGAGTGKTFRNAATLGGNAADWQYRTSAAIYKTGGFAWQAHWAYNISTGETALAKLKFLGTVR